jgi:hypothetical protein
MAVIIAAGSRLCALLRVCLPDQSIESLLYEVGNSSRIGGVIKRDPRAAEIHDIKLNLLRRTVASGFSDGAV